MSNIENDLFYVCTLIEFIGRTTKNHRGDIVKYLGISGIKTQLRDACVNHCLSFEQVCDETVEAFGIPDGNFDTVSICKYKVPSITSIGKLYARLVTAVRQENEDLETTIYQVFSSFISDAISDYNSSVYYSSPDYLKYSYLEGTLLP